MSSFISKPFLEEFENYVVDKNKLIDNCGNFGTIYKGYSKSAQKIVAVKFIPKEKLFPNYERELITLTDLCKKDHPNFIKFYDYHIDEKGIYYFMEYYKNGNLMKYIQKGLCEQKILTFYKQIVNGMIFLNQNNKVHRDLKSQNILIDDDQNVRITDFGLSRDIAYRMTNKRGTPVYEAPEVYFSKRYDERCDVWSSGMVLYEMLAGSFYPLLFQQKLPGQIIQEFDLSEGLKKLKDGRYKIKAPERVRQQWTQLLKEILVYKGHERKYFKEVKSLLQKFEEKMKGKYNYKEKRAYKFQEISQIRIQSKDENKYYLDRKKEQSGQMLQKCQKWLRFQRSKWDFMLTLKEVFQKPYNQMKNIHKLILIFLSYGEVIRRKKEIKEQLQQGELQLPGQKFRENLLHHEHQEKYIYLSNEALSKLKKSIEKDVRFVNKLLEQNKYFSKPQDYPEIDRDDELLSLIEDFKKGVFGINQANKLKYIQIMNCGLCHKSNKEIRQFKEPDLRTYLTIRLIGDIDNFILDRKYVDYDYVQGKLQQFNNYSLQDLDNLVDHFNYPK